MGRTSDNSWLKSIVRESSYLLTYIAELFHFFLILSVWVVITDGSFNWEWSWGQVPEMESPFHSNINWFNTYKYLPNWGSCWMALNNP